MRPCQPTPAGWLGQQKATGAGDGQHGRIFGTEGEAGAHAGPQPPAPRCPAVRAQRGGQANGSPEQGREQRTIGQNPACAADTEHRRQIECDRGPEARLAAEQVRGQAVDQKRRDRKQRHKRQPHDDRALAAGETRGRPGHPPCDRRMVEIAELQLAAGGDHVALVDAEAESRGKDQPEEERG